MAKGLSGKGKSGVKLKDIISLDISDIKAMQELLRIARSNARVYSKGRPEFGAYMHYSVFLEEGTTRGNAQNTMKTIDFSMFGRKKGRKGLGFGGGHRARPHIRPAVFANSEVLARGALELMKRQLIDLFTTGAGPKEDDVADYWERMLNGPVRNHALDSARAQRIYEYGFHMRSIMGHYKPPSPSKKKQFAKSQAAMRKLQAAQSRASKRGKMAKAKN